MSDPTISSREGVRLITPLMETRKCSRCRRKITYGSQRRFRTLSGGREILICYRCAVNEDEE